MQKFWSTGRLISALVVAAVLMGGCSFYSYANGVRTDGMQMEQGMSAQYKMNQNELSTYITKVYEMTDVANLKNDKMDSILTHAISGRYGKDGFKANGAFFAAVTEAYPKLDMTHYDRIMTAVESGREAFKNKQDKLTDMKRAYDTWRIDGFLRSQVTTKYFPSENLVVTVAGKKYTGKAALDKIDQMVLAEDASAAFDTGKMPTLDLKHR